MRVFRIFKTFAFVVPVAILAASGASSAKTPRLPRKAPVPEINRVEDPAIAKPPPIRDVPVPATRPPRAAGEIEAPAVVPAPPEKPANAGRDTKASNPAGVDKSPDEKKTQPDPRSAAMPGETMPAPERACRERLKALGVVFTEHEPAEHDASAGCSIPYPIVVSTLGGSIEIAPAAELNCRMAEAAASFMKDVVTPAAREEFGAEPKSIAQVSAYVCRARHNGGKISEHAFGNALDIASFTLTDGTRIDVDPKPREKQGKFLDKVRSAACGPFKTVLGPGSDPDHELHFHLDLEPRRHNGTFCQ
jgi:hypothetical protein